jgi:inhibitor of KinA sporulation pathway (predicted exonuclease)
MGNGAQHDAAYYRKRDKPEIFLSFDLEMNQPSGKIIQLGAVSGNIFTGEIAEERLSLLVQCGEPLCTRNNDATGECDIPKLTGITQKDIDTSGITLEQAYQELLQYWQRSGATSTFLTWGYGDVGELRSQLLREYPGCFDDPQKKFAFGHRSIDVKSLHQAWATMNGHSIKAGLSKALSKHELTFDGRLHNAMWDAYNTFKIAHCLFNKFKVLPAPAAVPTT